MHTEPPRFAMQYEPPPCSTEFLKSCVYCIAEARTAWQIWEARMRHSGGSWQPSVPTLGRGSNLARSSNLSAI